MCPFTRLFSVRNSSLSVLFQSTVTLTSVSRLRHSLKPTPTMATASKGRSTTHTGL